MNNFENREDIRRRYREEKDLSKVTVIPARPEIDPFDELEEKRVVIYSRVSTDGLSQVSSIELQKKYYMQYVRRHPDWKLVGIYSDEGGSGTNMDGRNGLLQMLEDARAGKFDMIVIKSLSRLARNLMDSMKIVYELRELEKPVGIYSETESIFSLDHSADFTLQVLSLVAQEESHKKSEAMTASYQQRFATANFTKPDILGYDKAGVNELKINEEEAKTVRLIYHMFLAGYETKEIAKELTRLKRKKHTHIYKDGTQKEVNTTWNEASILAVLDNEKYCGDVIAQKTYTVNYLTHQSKKNNNVLPQYHAKDQHQPIVSTEDYENVKRIQKIKRTGIKGDIPRLFACNQGLLRGFIISDVNDRTFNKDDYDAASASVFSDNISEHENFKNSISRANVLKEYKIIRQEGFCNNSQCLLTIDKNGFSFNNQCRKLFYETNYIQLAYHPQKQKIVILSAVENDICSIRWVKATKEGLRMHRISFKSLANTIYEKMDWNKDMDYRFSGHMVNISGELGIEFQLSKGIIILGKSYFSKKEKIEKQIELPRSVESDNTDTQKIDLIREMANPSKAYEVEILSDTGRGKRSHAIYFETAAKTIDHEDNDIITIDKVGEWIKSGNQEKLDKISMIYEVKKVQNNRYTINEPDIFEADLMVHRLRENSDKSEEALEFQECGWTSEIKLFDKENVSKLIFEIETANGIGNPEEFLRMS